MKAGNVELFRPSRFRAFEQTLREEYGNRMKCTRAVENAEIMLKREINSKDLKTLIGGKNRKLDEIDTVDKLLPIPSRSPVKKDLQLVQSSLENPLSSYMSSRRSFTAESPHFGQLKEPSTPQSLSKHPLHQHMADSNARISQQIMSIAADGMMLAEDSKFTFQGPLNDSSVRYDLKFDSFQQKPQVKKHCNIQIMNNYCRQVKEQSQEEDLKHDELNHQQSTSEPKSTDFYVSRDEEEDLEQLIASVSKRSARVPGAPLSRLFSSESTSQQQSVESQTRFSDRPEIDEFIADHHEQDDLGSSPKMKKAKAFYRAPRENLNIFKESMVEVPDATGNFGLETPKNFAEELDKENADPRVSRSAKHGTSQVGSFYAKLLDRDSKQLEYTEDLARGFKRKGLNTKPFCELQVSNSKTKNDTSLRPTSTKEKGNSHSKKKTSQVLSPRMKTKLNTDMAVLNNKFKSKMAEAGSTTPRLTSARKLKGVSSSVLRLDIPQTARSPRQTIQGLSQVANISGSTRISRKIGFFKDKLMSKIAQVKTPGVEKSFNASTLMKTVYQQPKRAANKSQTPLSKKELKKFMDKRKFTSTVAVDISSNPNTRSAVRLKSKRKSNSDIADKSGLPRSKTLTTSSFIKEAEKKNEALERSSARHGVRESKESASSYLGELLHERGFGRETLRASGESKMGEADRARLKQMADNHLELSKCLTSRTKPSLEIPLENSFVKSKVQHMRRCDQNTENGLAQRATRLRELDIGQPSSPEFTKFCRPQTETSLHRSREWSGRVCNVKVDISNLSSRVLSTMAFES